MIFLDFLLDSCTVGYFFTQVWLTPITLVSGVQHTDFTCLYIMLCSPQVQLPSVTTYPYHNTTDYIPHAVPFIPIALFLHVYIAE